MFDVSLVGIRVNHHDMIDKKRSGHEEGSASQITPLSTASGDGLVNLHPSLELETSQSPEEFADSPLTNSYSNPALTQLTNPLSNPYRIQYHVSPYAADEMPIDYIQHLQDSAPDIPDIQSHTQYIWSS